MYLIKLHVKDAKKRAYILEVEHENGIKQVLQLHRCPSELAEEQLELQEATEQFMQISTDTAFAVSAKREKENGIIYFSISVDTIVNSYAGKVVIEEVPFFGLQHITNENAKRFFTAFLAMQDKLRSVWHVLSIPQELNQTALWKQ